MKNSIIKIKTGNQSYNVFVGYDLFKNLLKILKRSSINFEKCLLVVDSKVPKKFIKRINLLLKEKNKFQYIFNSSEIQNIGT